LDGTNSGLADIAAGFSSAFYDTLRTAGNCCQRVAANLGNALDNTAHSVAGRVDYRGADFAGAFDRALRDGGDGFNRRAADFAGSLQNINNLIFYRARQGAQNVVYSLYSGHYGVGGFIDNLFKHLSSYSI
jgi:hypothetical protein